MKITDEDFMVAILQTAEKDIYDFLDGKKFVNNDEIQQSLSSADVIWDNVVAGKADVEDYRTAITKWKSNIITTFKKAYHIEDAPPFLELRSQKRRQLVY